MSNQLFIECWLIYYQKLYGYGFEQQQKIYVRPQQEDIEFLTWFFKDRLDNQWIAVKRFLITVGPCFLGLFRQSNFGSLRTWNQLEPRAVMIVDIWGKDREINITICIFLLCLQKETICCCWKSRLSEPDFYIAWWEWKGPCRNW